MADSNDYEFYLYSVLVKFGDGILFPDRPLLRTLCAGLLVVVLYDVRRVSIAS